MYAMRICVLWSVKKGVSISCAILNTVDLTPELVLKSLYWDKPLSTNVLKNELRQFIYLNYKTNLSHVSHY